MSYSFEIRERAQNRLRNLEKDISERILSKLDSIKSFPEHYLEWINKYKVHKLRVGDYRVFVDLDKQDNTIYVLEILHREKAYEGWG